MAATITTTTTTALNRFQSLAQQTVISFSERYKLATFPSHASECVVAFTTYTSLMHIISPALSRSLVPKTYGNLKPRTKINWNVRVVSFVQSILISYMAVRAIVSHRDIRAATTRDDRLWGYSPQYGTVQAWAAGYFLWDVLISAQYVGILGTSGLIHAVAALAVTMLGFRPFANHYGVCFVLYELSTPFLNIHWVLDKIDLTGSSVQLINGIALMASFFGCRLVWGSYQTWNLSRDILSAWRDHAAGAALVPRVVLEDRVMKSLTGPHTAASAAASGNAKYQFPAALLLTYLVANTALSTLNFYWFGLMVKAMLKRFSKEGDADGRSAKIDAGKDE